MSNKNKNKLTDSSHSILPEEEKTPKNKIKNVYEHNECGMLTEIPLEIAEKFADSPHFYSATYCATCKKYRPVAEFVWHPERTKVGS